jgi:hypothetical protein
VREGEKEVEVEEDYCGIGSTKTALQLAFVGSGEMDARNSNVTSGEVEATKLRTGSADP